MEIILGDLEKILTVVNNLSALNNRVTGENAENCLRGYGLTGAGLTNYSESLSLMKIKVNASNRLNLTVGGSEGYSEVFYMKFSFH